ncbi:MAG TPA: DUF1924 domain-containing protein, partial [Mariprofundaceae bacterium]|nr:DUF1924 domain-containing protein [Mariprofundaceae bacterium]
MQWMNTMCKMQQVSARDTQVKIIHQQELLVVLQCSLRLLLLGNQEKKMKKLLIITALLATPMFAQADVIQERLDSYKAEGASNFSAEAGKKMWTQVLPFEKKGELFKDRSCATCHNANPTTPGKHAKTGKIISPMTLGSITVNRKGEEE